MPTDAEEKRADRGGDCLDVIVVLSDPETNPDVSTETPLGTNDWTVTFKREGHVVRGARKVFKGVNKVMGAVGRRMSLGSTNNSPLVQTNLSKGDAARNTGVLKETFDDDESGDESDVDDDDGRMSDFGIRETESELSPTAPDGQPKDRKSRRSSMASAMHKLSKGIKSMSSKAMSKSPKKDERSLGRDLPSTRESREALSGTEQSDGDSPAFKQNFIGQDNFTIHVYVNGVYVPELEMRRSEGKKGTYGQFATFNHSNSMKPDLAILQKLHSDGVLVEGTNELRYVNNYQTKNDVKERSCTAGLHLWSTRSLLVISDIDGTVTKSDVVGLIDSSGLIADSYSHTHGGIAKFYSGLVRDCDVKFVYLTSRPISLMAYTRKYLRDMEQKDDDGNKYTLPVGCVLCHTGSIKDVLVTELIKKNPNEFKTDCIRRNVMLPFAAAGKTHTEKLFVAGFGNKQTDSRAYMDVGISMDDIYIINKSSSMLCEKERAELEVQAFHAVGNSGGGMSTKFRRNSILKSLPKDVAEGLLAGEISEVKKLRGSSMSGDDGDGDNYGGGSTRGSVKSLEDHDERSSLESRRRSFSAGAIMSGMEGINGMSFSDDETDGLTDDDRGSMNVSEQSPPVSNKMSRGTSDDLASIDRSVSGSDEMKMVRAKMTQAAMNSYSDGRLEVKIKGVCDKERGIRERVKEANRLRGGGGGKGGTEGSKEGIKEDSKEDSKEVKGIVEGDQRSYVMK
jgi:hypothetical protein